ncbi:DsbA family protein [Kitasatospora sp. NPDC097643]|uniref:DsbA family protein n=1 Tax=Kitasatospora sp. NPDC097643 TaxID=3157230 RepID=UPI003328FD9E
MRMRRRPRVYFSFRSPYSWMALDQLERRFPQAPELIDYYPFWEPDEGILKALHGRDAEVLYTPMSKAKHLYLLSDVKRSAQRFGYPLAWPIDHDQAWELPHLAWLKARRLGRERELYRALVEARWHRGEPICDPEVLARAADAAGLDGAELVAAEHDPEIRAEAVDALAAAYDDDVFGIPYFRIGRERLWGLDRIEDVLATLRTAFDEPADGAGEPAEGIPAALLDRVGAYDRDTAGGCG